MNASCFSPTLRLRANRAFTPDSLSPGNPWPVSRSKDHLYLTEHANALLPSTSPRLEERTTMPTPAGSSKKHPAHKHRQLAPHPPHIRTGYEASAPTRQRRAAANASIGRRLRIQQPNSRTNFRRKITTPESGSLSPPDTSGNYLSNTDSGSNPLTGK